MCCAARSAPNGREKPGIHVQLPERAYQPLARERQDRNDDRKVYWPKYREQEHALILILGPLSWGGVVERLPPSGISLSIKICGIRRMPTIKLAVAKLNSV